MNTEIEKELESKLADIWKTVDFFLDLKTEAGIRAIEKLGVSKDGPSVVLSERVRHIMAEEGIK